MLTVDEMVIRARAIRALPDDESWVHATPWNFNPKKEEQEEAAPEVIPFEPKTDEEREPEFVSKCVPSWCTHRNAGSESSRGVQG